MSKKYFFRRGIYEIRELEKGVRNGFTETAKMRSICVLRKQEKVQQTCLFAGLLAESEGFEPSVGINQHGFSSPQCKMEVNRKNRTLTHLIYLLRKIAEQQPFSYYYNLYSNSLQDPIFQEKWWRESR